MQRIICILIVAALSATTFAATRRNYALQIWGATCIASESTDSDCTRAIDGGENPTYSEWLPYRSPGPGTYIQINLATPVSVDAIELLQLCARADQTKVFLFEFSDGSETYAEAPDGGCTGSLSNFDCDNTNWQSFNIAPTTTTYVRITVVDQCAFNGFNGLREIRILGYPTGDVAQLALGGTCDTSAVGQTFVDNCQKIIDTDIYSSWQSPNQGPGAWLLMNFPAATVAQGRIQNSCDSIQQIKILEVVLNKETEGATQISLPCYNYRVKRENEYYTDSTYTYTSTDSHSIQTGTTSTPFTRTTITESSMVSGIENATTAPEITPIETSVSIGTTASFLCENPWTKFDIQGQNIHSVNMTVIEMCQPGSQSAELQGVEVYGQARSSEVWGNFALGATCVASSDVGEATCYRAIDGNENSVYSSWVPERANTGGTSIRLDFATPVSVESVGLLQPCNIADQSQRVSLRFSDIDGVVQYKDLTCKGGNSIEDCFTVDWENIDVGSIITTYINITVETQCSIGGFNGFREIRVLGYPTTNVAHRESGGTCDSSTTDSKEYCQLALDEDPNTAWHALHQGVNAQYHLNFPTAAIAKGRILNSCISDRKIAELEVVIDKDKEHSLQVNLDCEGPCDDESWETFPLPVTNASSIDLTVNQMCQGGTHTSELRALEIYGISEPRDGDQVLIPTNKVYSSY